MAVPRVLKMFNIFYTNFTVNLPKLSSGSTSGGRWSISNGVNVLLKIDGDGVSEKARPGIDSLCLITSRTVSRTVDLLEK